MAYQDKENKARWQREHREEYKERYHAVYWPRYYGKHKTEIQAKRRTRREENHAQYAKYDRKYSLAHPVKVKEKKDNWRKNNKAKVSIQCKKHYDTRGGAIRYFNRSGLPYTEELIALKTMQLQLRRTIRNRKQEEKV